MPFGWTQFLVIGGLAIFAGFSARADWAGTDGILSLRSEAFVSDDYSATPLRNYQFIGAGIRTPGLGPNNRLENLETGLEIEVDGQFAPQATLRSYLNIRQLYDQEGMLSVGRKLENWSLLDERWHFGMYQPQFRWNALDPQSQGLTGVFLHLRGKVAGSKTPWGVLFFGTPIFIPDQGPGYDLKDGKFEAVNPWFRPPQTRVAFTSTGAVDKTNYKVETPDTSRVIFNPGYAAQAYVGQTHDGAFAQAGFAYKPMNTLALPLMAQINPNNQVDVVVGPTFQYHTLLSADAQYAYEGLEAGIGALHEKPEDPKTEAKWTYRSYGESLLVSPFVGARIGWVKMRLMTLSVTEQDEGFKGPQEQIEPGLPHRYPFQNAGAAEASMRFQWARSEGVAGKVRYTQGSKDEFSLLLADARFQMNAAWSVWGQLVFVRAQADPNHRIFYSQYENNDYAQVGVQYVF